MEKEGRMDMTGEKNEEREEVEDVVGGVHGVVCCEEVMGVVGVE